MIKLRNRTGAFDVGVSMSVLAVENPKRHLRVKRAERFHILRMHTQNVVSSQLSYIDFSVIEYLTYILLLSCP